MLVAGKPLVSRVSAALLGVIADAAEKDPQLVDHLVGTLLADAHIEKRGNSARMDIKQGLKHQEWLLWQHSFLSSRNLCNPDLPQQRLTTSKNGSKQHVYLRIRLYSSSLLILLHSLFYKYDGTRYVKVLDVVIIPYLSPTAIAAWVADDGTDLNGSTAFCTDSFSPECLDILIYAMQHKYGITLYKFTHVGKYTRLAVSRADIPRFAALVKQHLHPTFHYKLGDFQ